VGGFGDEEAALGEVAGTAETGTGLLDRLAAASPSFAR
jgi:hypothetical protein